MRTIETPQDMQDLMRECIQVTWKYVDICNERWGLYLPHFKVIFSIRSGTAGKALINRGIVQFNPTLLRENPDEFLARTPGHEVVHHACSARYGHVQPHGKEWKKMMRELGLPDTRCHSFDTLNVPTNVGKIRNKSNTFETPDGVVKTFGIGKVIDFE